MHQFKSIQSVNCEVIHVQKKFSYAFVWCAKRFFVCVCVCTFRRNSLPCRCTRIPLKNVWNISNNISDWTGVVFIKHISYYCLELGICVGNDFIWNKKLLNLKLTLALVLRKINNNIFLKFKNYKALWAFVAAMEVSEFI